MQRKNNILNSHSPKRSGIAMIMAIAVIVVVSTILMLSLALTSQTAKKTTDLYLYEQAILLSQSATEYALLQIAQEPVRCNYTGETFIEGLYSIEINILYVYTVDCPIETDNYFPTGTSIQTPAQNGSVLMDVTVSTDAGTEPIRFFRRSIQKL